MAQQVRFNNKIRDLNFYDAEKISENSDAFNQLTQHTKKDAIVSIVPEDLEAIVINECMLVQWEVPPPPPAPSGWFITSPYSSGLSIDGLSDEWEGSSDPFKNDLIIPGEL